MKTVKQLTIQSAVLIISHCFCLGFAFAQNLSTTRTTQTTLPSTVAKLLQEAKLPESALGVIVIPAVGGSEQASLAINAELAKQPASIIKTLTAAIALDLLGPQYKGSTELLSPTKFSNGNATGDLVLRGSLNPEFDLRALEALLKQLRNSGVGLINGNVYVDRRAQNPERPDIGLPPFDEAPEFQYNFVPDALSLNMNLLPLVIDSTKDQIGISSDPLFQGLEFIQNMKLNDAPCKNWESTWKVPTANNHQITFSGEFPRNCRIELNLNIIDRTLFAELAFKNTWKNLGGLWTGQLKEFKASDPAAQNIQSGNSLQTIATHQSRPFSEFIRNINKSSDNPVTRLLFMALGEAQRKKETAPQSELSTAELSKVAIAQWLAVNGIEATGLVLDNGSGLSRSEKIAPITLAKVLQRAHASLWQSEFLASLPIVGLDGSMRNRLKESPATWRGRIKTGGLRNVSSIAGYVLDSKGQTHIIVAILNDDRATGPASRKVLDALLEWVATQ
jgi:serine-type D-Ala-D-Ala carboxypeptidase/endopeptidase (penicillin-binding protein 4)